jgi:hypothetical protein
MSILQVRTRPWMVFDVNDAEHRRLFYKYTQTGSWAHCPYRFVVPDDHGNDVTSLIQRELSSWYAAREFDAQLVQK